MAKKIVVLIVDDEPINITIAERLLQKEGYETLTSNNGFDALTLAVENQPDLILLDIMMPDMDGYEVCRQLALLDETMDIPVIFLSSLKDKDSLVQGFESGGKDYVSKPFNRDEFIARVKTHISLKLALQEQKKLVKQLSVALEEIKTLNGLIPICSHCHKIRDDKGYWQKVEFYIQEHSDAEFSHSICPDCMEKYFPKIAEKLKKRKEEEKT